MSPLHSQAYKEHPPAEPWVIQCLLWLKQYLSRVREALTPDEREAREQEGGDAERETDVHPVLLLKKQVDRADQRCDRLIQALQMRMNVRAHKQKLRQQRKFEALAPETLRGLVEVTRHTQDALRQAEQLGLITLTPQEMQALEQVYQTVSAQALETGHTGPR